MALRILTTLAAVLAAALAPAVASATLSTPPPRPQDPVPAVQPEEGDVHEQMKALIGKIERTLREVDDLLWDRGSASAKPPASVGARLARARDGSRRAIEHIDELLQLGEHEHPPGGS